MHFAPMGNTCSGRQKWRKFAALVAIASVSLLRLQGSVTMTGYVREMYQSSSSNNAEEQETNGTASARHLHVESRNDSSHNRSPRANQTTAFDSAIPSKEGNTVKGLQLNATNATLIAHAASTTDVVPAATVISSNEASTKEVPLQVNATNATFTAPALSTSNGALAAAAAAAAVLSRTTKNVTAANTTANDPPPPPLPHPFAGARHANGSWGYVPDVTLVRRNHFAQAQSSSWIPWPDSATFSAVCNVSLGEGQEKEAGGQVLARHVRVQHERIHPHRKILCATYTYDKNHDRVDAISRTFGPRCDGYFAASTMTVPELGAVDLPHWGPEEYNNMWQKTRSILAFMYTHFLHDYDYFFVAGDDTHLVVENLQHVLHMVEQRHGGRDAFIYTGAVYPAKRHDFCHGGSGYVVNDVALRHLVNTTWQHCLARAHRSSEDRFLGRCVHNTRHRCLDATDEFGRQTFHSAGVNFVATYQGNWGYFRAAYQLWNRTHGRKTGLDVVAPQSVAFHHFRGPALMLRHHAILYRSCPLGTMLGDDLAAIDANLTEANATTFAAAAAVG